MNIFDQMRDDLCSEIIKVPFNPDLTPRAQIEAAIASLPPRRCPQHLHELHHLDVGATVQNALRHDIGYDQVDWAVDFAATYDRCSQCPHDVSNRKVETENCAVGRWHYIKSVRMLDDKGIPLPRKFLNAVLEADQIPREQFGQWLAGEAELRCEAGNQMLRRRDASMTPPFKEWAISPHFPHCPRCLLERLGISNDESGATFDSFKINPPTISKHLEICRSFAAAPKGVLLLLGGCGAGKTHLAIAILREQLIRQAGKLAFIKHRHFLARHCHAQRPVAFGDQPPASPLEKCQEAKILVYDELTANTDNNRACEDVLLDLFERRITNFKPSIITSNLLPGELEAAVGTRLFDRLRRAAFAVLEFGFESKRPGLNEDYLRQCPS